MTIQEIKNQIMFLLTLGLEDPLAPITDASDEDKFKAAKELELEELVCIIYDTHPMFEGTIKRIIKK